MWQKHTDGRYGREWRAARERVLYRDKRLCQCKHCKAEGRATAATEVDHIVPIARALKHGWSWTQIHAPDNLQAINRDCHKRKTTEENGGKPKSKIGLDGFPVD